MIMDQIQKSAFRHRDLAQQLFMEPLISFVTGISKDEYGAKFGTQIQGLTTDLPPNVHLLTLEQWTKDHYLLRLEHFYQKNEHPELSAPAEVNMRHLFAGFEITHAHEVTLTANADVSELSKRLKFNYTPAGKVEEPPEARFDSENLVVKLNPMQIRTFLVRVDRGGKML